MSKQERVCQLISMELNAGPITCMQVILLARQENISESVVTAKIRQLKDAGLLRMVGTGNEVKYERA